MPGFALFLLRVALSIGLLLTAGTDALFAQERVGVKAAVNPQATGAVPGAAPRRLVIGQDVIFNERITTTDSGQTQLLFLDESSMSIGPNSDITIDQFVYDPKTGTGKLAMSATRGLLRYVGGKLSKQDEAVTLRTATATLAVRGGAFIAQIDPNGKTAGAFLYGKGLTVNGVAGGSETVKRPGFQSIVLPGGQPSPSGPMPPGLLGLYTQLLDGRSGSTGGAAFIPTDTTVVDSGISQTISGNVTQSFQQTGQTQGPDFNTCPQCNFQNQIQTAVNETATNAAEVTSPVTVTTTGSFAGVFKDATGDFPDQSASKNKPFNGGVLSNGTFSATAGGQSFSFPLATGTQTFSSKGSSSGGSLSGTSFLSNDGAYFYANVTAANGTPAFISGGQAVPSSALAPTGQTRIFAYSLSGAPSPSGVPFALHDEGTVTNPSLTPLYMVAPASTAIGDTSTKSASGTTIGARELHATVVISGQGSAQTSTAVVQSGIVTTLQSSGAPFITGAVRGVEGTNTELETITSPVSSVVDANGKSLYGSNAITGFTLDQTKYKSVSNTNPVATGLDPSQPQAIETEGVGASFPDIYGFAQPVVATGLPAGVGTNRTTQTLTGFFGGTMTTTAQSTLYTITGTASIATDNVANTLKATFTSDPLTSSATGGVTAVIMNFGGENSVFVDDNIFGAFENKGVPQQINGQQLTVGPDTSEASKLYLISSSTAALPTSLLPSGVSYCQCQFLQWGYWGGDLLTGNPNNDLVSRIDHGNINFWVGGVPTSIGDLNTLASQSVTGTYTGHAIGSVFNAGSNYVAVGGFTGTYNFGTQIGTMSVSNFDGKNFSTTGSAPLNGGKYSFTVAQPGVAGTINGAFFGPKAAETGGNFSVHTTAGPTYLASGIFAGKK
jgi:hypothetical protein